MFYSWAGITLLNWLWVIYLWSKRKSNQTHPWTVFFFGTYTVTDNVLWFMSPTEDGGIGLITFNNLEYQVWIFLVSILWLTWFVVPVWCACKLLYERIPFWYLWSLIVLCLFLSGSEYLGLTTHQRRFAMHAIAEPIMLIVALGLIAKYLFKQIKECGSIDYLSYAVALTSMMLLLKLGLLFSGDGLLKRWQSHTFYYLFFATIILSYRGHERLKSWLMFH